MKNFVQPGDNVDIVADRDLKSGDGFLDGVEFSVASTDIADGDSGVGVTKGVFDLKKAAVAPSRKTIAYWDDTNHVVTNVATDNTKIGIFQAAAASGDATARVKLVSSI
jgi:predicted RecA/RadA family phage recombinase